MAQEKSFAYVRQDGNTYKDLLNSVSVVDEETAKREKKLAVKKNKYYADKLVIYIIIENISHEPLDLTKLIAQVMEETGVSKANCRKIVDRYKGKELDDFVFWGMAKPYPNTSYNARPPPERSFSQITPSLMPHNIRPDLRCASNDLF